jgi:hypothetical protein
MSPADGSVVARLRVAFLVAAHATTYAVTVAVLVGLGAFVLGIATGGGFARVKVILFLAGLGMMAYATARLWPRSPSDVEPDGFDGVTVDDGSIPKVPDRTRFQRVVRSLPPSRWLPPAPPLKRVTPAGKLFLGSVLVLLASYLLEVRFGVV